MEVEGHERMGHGKNLVALGTVGACGRGMMSLASHSYFSGTLEPHVTTHGDGYVYAATA